MARKTLNNSVIRILDGNTPPSATEVKIGTGNLTWSEAYAREYETERGSVANGTVRDGDESPCEVSVTGTWTNYYSHGTEDVTPIEAMRQLNGAAAWVTSGADACEPYAVDIEVFCSHACNTTTGNPAELIIFPEFRVESANFDLDAGTITFSGKCKAVAPTVSRQMTDTTTTA